MKLEIDHSSTRHVVYSSLATNYCRVLDNSTVAVNRNIYIAKAFEYYNRKSNCRSGSAHDPFDPDSEEFLSQTGHCSQLQPPTKET